VAPSGGERCHAAGLRVYATGDYSDGQIARWLNRTSTAGAMGHRFISAAKPSGRGAPGPFAQRERALAAQRPFYTGVVAYYGVAEPEAEAGTALYPGRHPALIDQRPSTRCQQVRRAWGTAVRGRANRCRPGSTCCRACCTVGSAAE